ncbi:MAG: helix-turn-helix transcriptional regulator, partial [Gammaproteobacteria bacterium]
FETVLMVIGAVGVGMLVDRMHLEHKEKLSLIQDLSIARDEGEGWRSRVQSQVAGIGAEIERQFDSWRLTAAEREVGLLMLKGLSHKEIAAVRVTAEATVRQQARSIYQKTNLPSKTAFCAYFLEDLLPPARESGLSLVGDTNDEPFAHACKGNGVASGADGCAGENCGNALASDNGARLAR